MGLTSCGMTEETDGDLPPSRADAFEDDPAPIDYDEPGFSSHICTIQLGDFSSDERCFDSVGNEWCCYPAVCGAEYGECGAAGAGGLGGAGGGASN